MTKVSSLYLHFPVCRHLCNYCDFYRIKRDEAELDIQFFHDYLENGEKQHQHWLERNQIEIQPMETLFFGGGTPSLWGTEGAQFFSHFFRSHYAGLSTSYEWTMELNPGSWGQHKLENWLDLGVNRISVGIQSLNSHQLKILDRVHSQREARETLQYLQQLGINYSVDLMIGLPVVDGVKRNILKELEEILVFSPAHFSVYILTVKSGYKWIESLPHEDEIALEYLLVSEFLRSKGFEHYEVSNFALPRMRSRHNQKYWNSESVLAIGPSATGFLASTGRQRAIRYKWKTQRPQFEIEELTQNELLTEKIYLKLRMKEGFQPEEYYGTSEMDQVRSLLASWQAQKLGMWEGDRFCLLPQGCLLLDTLVGKLLELTRQE